MSTWLLELQEIWVTELLEEGEGERNKLLRAGVKHLHFVLCTDRPIFGRNCNKAASAMCTDVNNAQTYHSETLLSRQDSQTRTNRASVWGPKKQIKALNSMFLMVWSNRYCFTTFHCISSFKILLSTIPAQPGSRIWQQHRTETRSAYQAIVLSPSV